jgi:hypothetical protein
MKKHTFLNNITLTKIVNINWEIACALPNFKQFNIDFINIMKLKTIILLLLFLSSLCFSSCSLFKKKNKCDTCPSWTMNQIITFEKIDTNS